MVTTLVETPEPEEPPSPDWSQAFYVDRQWFRLDVRHSPDNPKTIISIQLTIPPGSDLARDRLVNQLLARECDRIVQQLNAGTLMLDVVLELVNNRSAARGTVHGDDEIASATSVFDYLGRKLGKRYLPQELQEMARLERPPWPFLVRRPDRNAPMCYQCEVQMLRAGSCHACPSCGTTSGCS